MQTPPPILSPPPIPDGKPVAVVKGFSRFALAGFLIGSLCLLIFLVSFDICWIGKKTENQPDSAFKAGRQFGYVAPNLIVPALVAGIACCFGKRRASHQFVFVFFIVVALLSAGKLPRLQQLLMPSPSQNTPTNR